MRTDRFKLFPLGDCAYTFFFGDEVDERTHEQILAIVQILEENPPIWLKELIPSYTSLTFCFDPLQIGSSPRTTVANAVREAEARAVTADRIVTSHEVPVLFGGSESPDLDFVAETTGLTTMEVIETFLSREYRVYLIGFLPGFPYMASTDPKIAIARRETPRKRVPTGSIGLAGNQTGIYPFESPGGWQLIGRTRLNIFDPDSERPSLFSPGDKVRFIRE